MPWGVSSKTGPSPPLSGPSLPVLTRNDTFGHALVGAPALFRHVLNLAAILLALALPSALGAQPAGQRVVAVADLHGDFAAWLDIARDAKLIDASNHWAGGRTTLVQLGDISDRGPDTLKIIRHLQQLEAEAPKSGGKVIVLLGNHEAMNLTGDLRYVTAQEYAAFADAQSPARREAWFNDNRKSILDAARKRNPKATEAEAKAAWIAQTPLGWAEHRKAWLPSGEIGRWAAARPAIARVGTFLFVHGGLSAENSKQSINSINGKVAAAMRRADDSMESILSDPLGPLWYRGLIARDNDAEAIRSQQPGYKYLPPAEEVDLILDAYNAKHLVVGHTPTLKGVTILHGGKLVRADTGISRYYKGPLGWLEIVGETMTPRVAQRSATR